MAGPVLTRYAESTLPTPWGEARLVVYRTGRPANLGQSMVGAIGAAASLGELAPEEHAAIVFGDVAGTDALTRVHSSCFTGEVLHSLRCDCREQLEAAIARVAQEGRGVLVYLVQEGRGIGLGNKIKAYALQDAGIDTVDANLELGFGADDREYAIAVDILRDLQVASVRLMTNNPRKLEGLRNAGIVVSGHLSHWVDASTQSQAYLEIKKTKMGHLK